MVNEARRALRRALLSFGILAAGCSTDTAASSTDVGTSDAASGAGGAAQQSADATSSAGPGSGGGGSSACAAGAATSLFAAGTSSGDTCNADAAVIVDGTAAGLDTKAGALATQIAGQYVTGCIGVDFGADLRRDVVSVRAGTSPKACDEACKPDPTDGCGTVDEAHVFYGSDPDAKDLAFADTIHLVGEALLDYPVSIGHVARYVVVCRTGAGPGRDDVRVDGVVATCP
jgi:hypothetical protein